MSDGRTLAIEAGILLTPSRRLSPGRLIVVGNVIAEADDPSTVRIPAGAERIDASQFVVTPGFIDPHIHGSGGVDVMAATFESLNVVSVAAASHGTTSFLPTTVSSPLEELTTTIEKLGSLIHQSFDGARPLGIHLEGPFINAARRGTHSAANVSPADPGVLEEWIRSSGGSIRLITVAPEITGVDAVIDLAMNSGVKVAMGHSNATFEQAAAAAGRGVCYAVHTFNAMREFKHRDPGIVGQVLSNDEIFAEIIADGVHVDPSVVRLFARAKNRTRVVLATDATSATGMQDGRYMLGTNSVDVVNGVCRDGEGRLAGSTLTQEVALRNFAAWSGVTIDDAVLGLTLNPASALGLQKKGVLEPGADADITIIDHEFRVRKTFVAGKLVFERD